MVDSEIKMKYNIINKKKGSNKMFKQLKFFDREANEYLGGIGYFEEQSDGVEDLKYIICGCCGGIIDGDELEDNFEIIEIYNNWCNLTEAICGD